jgi:hypothetical protein
MVDRQDAFFSVEVDVSELMRLADALAGVEGFIEEAMGDAMDESGMLLTGMAAARAPVNYGLLRAAIAWPYGFERSNLLDELRGAVGAGDAGGLAAAAATPSTYVDWVEHGTDPHWPPLAPIELWALRKFPGEDALTIAKAVRAKIARVGTQGAHMFERAWDEGGQSGVARIWNKVPEKVVQKLEQDAK